jgi:hypothetical protein
VNLREILKTLKLYLIILPKKSTTDEFLHVMNIFGQIFACDEYIWTKIILVTKYEK